MRIFVALLIVCLQIVDGNWQNGSTLRYVQAIWRHGDRAPLEKPYPSDIYDESHWPRGWGQLTTDGMEQLQELGQFLRDRYVGTFLSNGFNRKEVYIRSTEVDRAIESAQSLVTGMFPPDVSERFASNFNWQPVAIHTPGGTKNDLLLHPWTFTATCAAYRQQLQPIRKESDRKLLDQYADLVRFVRPYLELAKKDGPIEMMELMRLRHIMPEIIHKMPQPEWVLQPWPQYGNRTTIDIIWEIRAKNWLTDFQGSDQISKFIGGMLLGTLLKRFESASKAEKLHPSKMFLYSAHDNTLLILLSALKIAVPENIYDLPPYASCILMELHQFEDGSDFYVKFFYRRNKQLEEIVVDGCTTNCSLAQFGELTKPRAILGGPEELQKLCALNEAASGAIASQTAIFVVSFLPFLFTIFVQFKF